MNVFLISSPLQLINAIEARHHFGIESADAVLVLMPIQYGESDLTRLQSMAGQTEWARILSVTPRGGEIEEAGPAPLAAIRRFRRFVCELGGISKGIGPVESVFLGHYGDKWRRHFANVIPHARTYVLDDGFATLTASRFRRECVGRHPYRARFREAGAVRAFLEFTLGARFSDLDRVIFFTAYDIRPSSCDAVVPNTYAYLRSLVDDKTYADGGIMLGSPLVENELLDDERYCGVVRTIKEDGGGRLTYYPHRAEDPTRVRRMGELLSLTIRMPSLPFEWDLLTGRFLPSYLAGFHSSALYNCRLLFGNRLKIRAYRPNYREFGLNEAVAPARYEAMGSVYAYFAKRSSEHFRVIDLNPSDIREAARA